MSWLRIDDGFASHPKLAGLTDRQHRVWIRTLCYCAKYGSAELSEAVLREIPGFDGGNDGALMRGFLKARLVDYVNGTYLVHDWDEYQPKDPTGAERQARWRKNRNAGVTGGVTENVTPPSRPVLEEKSLSELQGAAEGRTPTEAEIATAREKRQRAGYIENLGKYTGCRFVRGEHSNSAVYDPLGTEPPPADWPYERPTRDEIKAALHR